MTREHPRPRPPVSGDEAHDDPWLLLGLTVLAVVALCLVLLSVGGS